MCSHLVRQTWGSSNVQKTRSEALVEIPPYPRVQHGNAQKLWSQGSRTLCLLWQPCSETELHGLGMQPWDAPLDSPPLEMGEDDPFLANQHLALGVRPALPPGLQLLLSRAKSLLQVLEEAQVLLSLCEEPCSHWSICFHVSSWMFRLNLHIQVPQLCLFSGKCSLEEGSMWDKECVWIVLGAKQLVHHLKCCSVFVMSSAKPRIQGGVDKLPWAGHQNWITTRVMQGAR